MSQLNALFCVPGLLSRVLPSAFRCHLLMLAALPFRKPRLFTYLLEVSIYLTEATFSLVYGWMHRRRQREEMLVARISALIIDLDPKSFFKHLELKFPMIEASAFLSILMFTEYLLHHSKYDFMLILSNASRLKLLVLGALLQFWHYR